MGDSWAGQVRVADEDQVRAKALPGQLEGQLLHPHAQSPGHGVLVGSLEGEEHEVHCLRREAGKSGHGVSWGDCSNVHLASSIPSLLSKDARSGRLCYFSSLNAPTRMERQRQAWQ